MRNVLLGAGGTGTAFAIASRLRATWGNTIKLVVTDIYDENLVTASLLADKFYKVPYANAPSFGKALRDIMLNESIQTYIPILNDEIVLANGMAKDPALRHVDFWSSDMHALCTDKVYADEWLRSIGVRTPENVDLSAIEGKSGPWFAKPRRGFGSRGAHILHREDLANMKESDIDDLIIQELCEKPEVTVDSFYDSTTGTGYAYCRERLETKSGVCTKARLFADAELSAFATKIGQALEQRGTICFQVMRSKRGWVATDLNLRSGAGTAMTCSAGYDVLSAAFACRIGEDYSSFVKPLNDKEEYLITRQYSEFVMRHDL